MSMIFRALGQISVSWKIGAMVAMLMIVSLVIAGISTVSMMRIGTEIEEIAEDVIPLIEDSEQVTMAQLEQGIAMQSFLRHAAAGADAEMTDAAATFDRFGATADERLVGAVEKSERLVTRAASATAETEWAAVRDSFRQIAAAHADFEAHVHELFDLAKGGGDIAGLTAQIDAVEAEEADLKHAIEALGSDLIAISNQSAKMVKSHEETSLTTIAAVAAVGLAVGALLATLIALGITRPLTRTVRALKALEEGDKSQNLEVEGKDEMATVAKAYESLRQTLLEAERREARQEEEQRKLEEENRQKMLELADRFESDVGSAVSTISAAIEELTASSNNLGAIAEENERQATAVSSAAEQSSGNVQAVSAAAEELSTSITEISRQVAESSRIAGEASGKADNADTRVDGLTASAEKIDSVVQLIQQIAEQTNLLALNATIEAARAGEAGKGFAVVAEEVKSLANQTANATEQVSEHIAEVQGETKATTEAIKEVNAAIKQIDENATSISAAVEQQGTATQEIARNVQEASTGTSEVTQNITGVTQAANETGSAASQVQGAANELSQQASALDSKVKAFLDQVRDDNRASTEEREPQAPANDADDAGNEASVEPVPKVAAE